MRNMFKTMAQKLSEGEDLVLVTVVTADGATPRGACARMLISKGGRLCGTIGGGAVEYRSEQIAAEVLQEKCSGEHDFNLTHADVENLGMICGGAVKVYFRFITAGDEYSLSVCRKAEELFKKGLDIWLIFDIAKGGIPCLYTKEEGFFGSDEIPDWVEPMLTRHPKRKAKGEYDFYMEQINSCGMVYVFGCGHVAQQLVPVISKLGFRCI